MSTIINEKILDAAYVELSYRHDLHMTIRFAWIDDRLFLSWYFLGRDSVAAIHRIIADPKVEIYIRGSMDYFVPYEWLLEQRPDLEEILAQTREIAEPFRHKLGGDPCGVCPQKIAGDCDK